MINIIFLFVFLELGSLGWYFFKYKQFFYTREKVAENNQGEELENQEENENINTNTNPMGINLAGIRLEDSVIERIHPYFGYVQKPGPDFRKGFKYNTAGFISPYDYPYQKKHDNQYIIGIFGGSVASNYSIYEIQNQILEKKLRQIPEFKDREFIILSFATGGYKQPQQLILLNYFLSIGQQFDMIINIDGFNEVTLAKANNKNNIDIMMPSTNHVVPLTNIANNSLSTKSIRAMLKINDSKGKLKDALETLDKCQVAYCYALTSIYVQNLASTYRKNVKIFDKERKKAAKQAAGETEASIVYFYAQSPQLEKSELYKIMAEHWKKASIMMKQIAANNNILYFHILQPNQYYPTNRIYSEAEKKIAFDSDTPFKEATELGYPVLLNKIDDLKNNGVNIFNGVNILDNEKEIVYIDSCCHYTKTGENILSEYIANSIFNILAPNQKSKVKSQKSKVRSKK
ncbi:hypothetical protein [Okeania sp. KiyG1]|uniref:hypothetical protein n=1 Tax=Okeania sp. KiyG1 TaxID=2720165 RepID=UPI0027D9E346|nr:hypothetical protein [Okeania sp. KiyG1]